MSLFKRLKILFSRTDVMEMSQVIELLKWSKTAEWRTGPKQMFMQNDWENYIKEFKKSMGGSNGR